MVRGVVGESLGPAGGGPQRLAAACPDASEDMPRALAMSGVAVSVGGAGPAMWRVGEGVRERA